MAAEADEPLEMNLCASHSREQAASSGKSRAGVPANGGCSHEMPR